MRASEFSELRAFASVVQHKSFTRAAAHLRVSPSALSQTIRALEERLGMRLLNRTTRSVALTLAGSRLNERLTPALGELEAAVGELNQLRDKPAGLLRINVPRFAASQILAPLIGEFHKQHPDIVLEILTDDAITDVVAAGFDAGMRLGEKMAKDMIAIPITGALELTIVASPLYFAKHGQPQHPRDLQKHRCINIRMPTSGNLYRWEFDKGRRSMEISVEGPLITNEPELVLRAAIDGVGIGCLFGNYARPAIKAKKLIRVLEDWSPPFPGLYLYYPSRRHTPPALRAFIDFMRRTTAPAIAASRT
jgi:DNA-binding transcriptional LysR family regulator